MSGRDDYRIFVGGLTWSTSERILEDAFSRYGKIIESLVMVERDTGRPRGFGFITFADRRGMDDAIREMHGRELDGQVITVNRAQPKRSGDDSNYGGFNGSREDGRDGQRGGSYRDSYRGGDNKPLSGNTDCFKCGRPGHFARECPNNGGGGGGGRDRFSRFGGDRFEDRFDGGVGRYGDRERVDVRESRYGSRDRYVNNDRYPLPAVGERFGAGDRYLERETSNGYGKERDYVRDLPRGGGGERYGSGGPARYERGSYRERSGPYDRAGRGGGGGGRGGGRPGAYDRY